MGIIRKVTNTLGFTKPRKLRRKKAQPKALREYWAKKKAAKKRR